jgi:uncharacterized protein YbaR (Trm112 family)
MKIVVCPNCKATLEVYDNTTKENYKSLICPRCKLLIN